MDRLSLIHEWLDGDLGYSGYHLEAASGDASFRRYFRLRLGEQSFIVMDAPPEREDSRPFVRIGASLRRAGLSVPEVLAADLGRGLLLLTDLGSVHYLDRLTPVTRGTLYGDAIEALDRMQTRMSTAELAPYGADLLRFELSLFRDWFLGRHLGVALGTADEAIWAEQGEVLVAAMLSQPIVFVHRDYHSRNLMVLPAGNPGILDFQGAVAGPITYDLVSLLRDCYCAWPAEEVTMMVSAYYQDRAGKGFLAGAGSEQFQYWFDLTGLQRHLKALGIFARLWHRDGKSGYLADMPRTLAYVRDVTERHPALRPLGRLLAELEVSGRLTALPARVESDRGALQAC